MGAIGAVSHKVQLYSVFDRADPQPANMYLGAAWEWNNEMRVKRRHSLDTRSTLVQSSREVSPSQCPCESACKEEFVALVSE